MVSKVVTKTITDDGKKQKTDVGISICSLHRTSFATRDLYQRIALQCIFPDIKFCNDATLPRSCVQTTAGPQILAKYLNIAPGWYLIQSRDPRVETIDFHALLSNFEEAVSIPGLLGAVKLEFNEKTVTRACYRDLDDFLNNKKKPG